MRRLALCGSLMFLAACAKPEQQAAKDSTAASLGAGAAAPALTLESVAGKWSVKTSRAGSDSVLLTYELVATADPAGWTLNFPGRPPVPARAVTVAGDSITLEAGPYESVLRKGVQVTVNSVMRLENGELVGRSTAHYAKAGPDSVIQLQQRGTRQ